MTTVWLVSLVAILGGFLAFVAIFYFQLRGARVVTCPETRQPVGVEVDATHALSAVFRGGPELRLASCTRWPERQNCGQECLSQIEASPDGCLVRNVLSQWYAGKTCKFCGKHFGAIQWNEHKPALLSPESRIVDWHDVPPQDVPRVLETHQAVCWDCNILKSFQSRYPDIVVDRARIHDPITGGVLADGPGSPTRKR